jgi:hypothetical protein
MSQAESVPTTSRRRFLQAGAAASLAVPAVALPFADAEVLAMEPVVADLWKRLGPVLDEANRCDNAMFEWRRQNPEPLLPTPPLSERGHRAVAELQKALDANEPDEAVRAKHEAEHAVWAKREAPEWQAAKAASEEHQRAFWDEQAQVVETLSAMPATTLEGLRTKARAALLMDEEALAWSIVEDLAGRESDAGDNEGGK